MSDGENTELLSEQIINQKNTIIKLISEYELPHPKTFTKLFFNYIRTSIENSLNPFTQQKQIFWDVFYKLKNLESCKSKERKRVYKSLLKMFEYNTELENKVVSISQIEIDNEINMIVNPPKIISGTFKCGKCHTFNTYHYSAQTRGADEGMTTFIFCLCGNRWKDS